VVGVTLIAGQLEFDLEATMTSRMRDVCRRPDHSGRLGLNVTTRMVTRPCVCEKPMVFAAELGDGACGLCGREPAR
jgi:hypothetical protein